MPDYEEIYRDAQTDIQNHFIILEKFKKNLWICLSRNITDEARETAAKNLKHADRVFKGLRDCLLVVKLCDGSASSVLRCAQEGYILEQIKNAPNSQPGIWFPEIVTARTFMINNTEMCSWFAMTAFDPPLTLHALQSNFELINNKVFPVEFIAHVFLQLCEIIGFLHKNCRIAINNLHERNIIINLAAPREANGLPKLALVDFAEAIEGDAIESGAITNDVKGLCSVIKRLLYARLLEDVTISPENAAGLEGFEQFKSVMVDKSAADTCDPSDSIDGLKTMFEAQAKTCVESCPKETAKSIITLAKRQGRTISEKWLRHKAMHVAE